VRHFKQACVILTAAIAITFGSPSYGAAEPISIEGGQIADPAPDSSGIRIFKGIPYAAPPLDELRWRAPQPVQKWQGVRDIEEWGPRCVQSKRLGDLDPLNCDGRGLPLSQHLDVREIGRRKTSGHGLDIWRQQSQRCRFAARI